MAQRSTGSASGLSRRALLGRAAVLLAAGAATLASSVAAATRNSGDALAQAKVSKQEAQYQDQPKGEQRCSRCAQFQPPSSCRVIEGNVSPNGWCRFFEPRGG